MSAVQTPQGQESHATGSASSAAPAPAVPSGRRVQLRPGKLAAVALFIAGCRSRSATWDALGRIPPPRATSASRGCGHTHEIAYAQAAPTRAEQNYANARYSYLIAMSRLEYAMGVGQTPATLPSRHP